MAPMCTAKNLSDQSACKEEAVSINGLFCGFHSKQCQGLYRGYKRRNAELDNLAQAPPSYLKKTSVALANQTFEDLDSIDDLEEIHKYLSKRLTRLDQVIAARKLHHIHFFAETSDYGHQHFIDNLQSQKFIVNGALARLAKQHAAVLYENENWFQWVRERQNEEEAQRDNEKKKVKREAALWKRHWKQLQLRMKLLRDREDRKRQDDFLEQAYSERLSMEEEESWDPIEDVVEDERGNYLAMIKMFLLRNVESNAERISTDSMDVDAGSSETSSTTDTKSTGRRPRKKPQKDKASQGQDSSDKPLPETRQQIRQRLREGVKLKEAPGFHIRGTMENPVKLRERSAPLPDNEIDKLLEEVAEVKELLLCRILLSHAALLPAAARSNSVDEFLNDESLDSAQLRDLCLELETPGLQDVRDACADLVRGDNKGIDPTVEKKQDQKTDRSSKDKTKNWVRMWPPWEKRPENWIPKRELEQRQRRFRHHQIMKLQSNDDENEVNQLNFDIDDQSMIRNERMRVKVCGRYIYNYPSENRMGRGGWLQFCVIAKDSNLFDAINLCRNWEEFYELNILAVWQFFPGANWLLWVGDHLNQQLLQMGFIPYERVSNAKETTVHHQSGSRGMERRAHAVIETRNFIAAHIRRDDQISRRFIRYLSMESNRIMLLVRDGKTGRILISPPPKELWLVREKSGLGRAVKKPWKVLQEVGKDFFENLESRRKWTFGFDDYFDIVVWDNEPGEAFHNVYNAITEMLYKAHRVQKMSDTYNLAAPILKTLTREQETMRVREIQHGEDVVSIYHAATDPRTRFMFFDTNDRSNPREIEMPSGIFYDETDEAEDKVLFPEEYREENTEIAVGDELHALAKLEYQGPDMRRFTHDLDTDDELPDEDEGESKDRARRNNTRKTSDSSGDDSWEDEDDCVRSEDGSDGDSTTASEVERCEEIFRRRDPDEIGYLKHFSKFPEPSSDPNHDMKGQWLTFLTRETAKIVKEGWHNADLEPDSQWKYATANEMIKKMVEFNRVKWPLTQLSPIAFLNINPYKNRKVIPDMERAFSMMSFFFPSADDFFRTEPGREYESHPLINQSERAKHLPVRRYKNSNRTMAKEFWREWDQLRSSGNSIRKYFPSEWNAAIRPIIAHLYKEGVLLNSYVPDSSAQAIASREPTGKLDFYVDNRVAMPHSKPHAGSIDPPEKETLFKAARNFAAQNPDARFAFLRVWSAPHFYPLIVGPDRERREEFSFMDGLGRCWAWKFVPKDFPGSEMSIHMAVHYRMQPFRKMFRDRLIYRSDTLLVMGDGEKELLKLASAATFVIQDEPWRLEVDLWKSFVNIDIQTLEGLDVGWLD